jgi:hypothetical protein
VQYPYPPPPYSSNEVGALFKEHVDVAAIVTDARALAATPVARHLWTQPVALLWLLLAAAVAQVIHFALIALGRRVVGGAGI